MFRRVADRPVLPRMGLAAQRRTMSRCHRRTVSGVTSSRRDSRSHEVIRVITRKTNRRHMTGDHYGRTARRATLLVTAADEILGTHRACHGRRLAM
jgi:hypothetical protein